MRRSPETIWSTVSVLKQIISSIFYPTSDYHVRSTNPVVVSDGLRSHIHLAMRRQARKPCSIVPGTTMCFSVSTVTRSMEMTCYHHVVDSRSYDDFFAHNHLTRQRFCPWVPVDTPEGSMASKTLAELSTRSPGILLTYTPVHTPHRLFSVDVRFACEFQVRGEPPGSEHRSKKVLQCRFREMSQASKGAKLLGSLLGFVSVLPHKICGACYCFGHDCTMPLFSIWHGWRLCFVST